MLFRSALGCALDGESMRKLALDVVLCGYVSLVRFAASRRSEAFVFLS